MVKGSEKYDGLGTEHDGKIIVANDWIINIETYWELIALAYKKKFKNFVSYGEKKLSIKISTNFEAKYPEV